MNYNKQDSDKRIYQTADDLPKRIETANVKRTTTNNNNNSNNPARNNAGQATYPSSSEQKQKHDESDNEPRSSVRRNNRRPKVRNTISFEPLDRPVDMRIRVCNARDTDAMTIKPCIDFVPTTHDVIIIPDLFSDFNPGQLYDTLENEIKENRSVRHSQLMKLWHGDTHYIADDHTSWKQSAPTFNMILKRLQTYFGIDIKATRLNWYKDTSHWKPMHHDQAALRRDSAETQNITVAVSFGATREVAFEHATNATVVSVPHGDGWVYAFTKDTNINWRHGILKETNVRNVGRISIIVWAQKSGLAN